ncbi:hypothetical protein [Thauera humireducens]|uniref:hypothetical protein n=1 Tax=Thauera humireducens TaxID=1134435 RepID=UPI00312016EC
MPQPRLRGDRPGRRYGRARALPAPDGSVIAAAALQSAALATLADLFAVVVANGAAIPD